MFNFSHDPLRTKTIRNVKTWPIEASTSMMITDTDNDQLNY